MTLDPYRTLGLEPGASMPEVKRAYRRLAKAFHPDSAGEAALPRFLAIHEAYEALRTGRPMGAPRAASRPAAAAPPAAEPWRADPTRARAARDRARTGRAGRHGAGAGAGGDASRAGGASRAGSRGTSGTSGTRSGRRGPRKATLGSTSYDEARDPADATWSGASWYGPTSGEYWIINPREYADPRKHGPEYQSRARRTAADPSVSGTIGDDAPFVATPDDEAEVDVERTGPRADATREGKATASRQASQTRAAAADPARSRTRAQRSVRTARPTSTAAPTTTAPAEAAASRQAARAQPFPTLGEVGPASAWRAPSAVATRDRLGGPADDPIRRLGVALVAWPPIGLAAAMAIGEVTGCASFSAACAGTDSLLPWLAQAGILGLLLLLPPLARLLAGGTIGVVLALLPVTAFLVVVGGSGQSEAGFALAFLLGIAWLLGVGSFAIAALRRKGASIRVGGTP